ncbi:MAG: hypothetical protein HFJ38_07485, partial [Bacilli bacterium]|nr:hypothetical protein [Bacilli bacterium]
MKKLIVTIIAMLFAVLCIPNCSRAAFYTGSKSIGGIYTAMRNNGSAWLNADITGLNNSLGWSEVWNLNGIANGYKSSVVWSTGGSCCGHGSEAVGTNQRKIMIIDINEATTNNKLRYLAYAILYSTYKDEHTTQQHIGSEGTPGTPVTFKGKWAITNWLHRNKTSYGIKVQFTTPGVQNYDENYGALTIGNKTYSGVNEFVEDGVGKLQIDNTEMKEDEEDGHPLKIWETEKDGDNCTVIGPYHLNIDGGLESAKMKFVNNSGDTKEPSAIGYCTTVNGNLKKFNQLKTYSATNRFYLVFSGHLKGRIKTLNSITLRQKVGAIKARLVFSEAGGVGQDVAIFYGEGATKENTLTLPKPQTTLELVKIDADTEEELSQVRLILKNLDKGKYLKIKSGEINWVNNVGENASDENSATRLKSGQIIKGIPAGRYALYEIKRENKFYAYCNWENLITVKEEFTIEKWDYKVITARNKKKFGYATVKKVDADTKRELKKVKFVLHNVDTGKYVVDGKNTTTKPNQWSSTGIA